MRLSFFSYPDSLDLIEWHIIAKRIHEVNKDELSLSFDDDVCFCAFEKDSCDAGSDRSSDNDQFVGEEFLDFL